MPFFFFFLFLFSSFSAVSASLTVRCQDRWPPRRNHRHRPRSERLPIPPPTVQDISHRLPTSSSKRPDFNSVRIAATFLLLPPTQAFFIVDLNLPPPYPLPARRRHRPRPIPSLAPLLRPPGSSRPHPRIPPSIKPHLRPLTTNRRPRPQPLSHSNPTRPQRRGPGSPLLRYLPARPAPAPPGHREPHLERRTGRSSLPHASPPGHGVQFHAEKAFRKKGQGSRMAVSFRRDGSGHRVHFLAEVAVA